MEKLVHLLAGVSTLIIVLSLVWFLGWYGLVGGLIAVVLYHIWFRGKNGRWMRPDGY